jgi:hypothetical protein
VNVVALAPDLMDQSRIRAALPDVTFARDPAGAAGAAVVMVDLARFADRVAQIRAATDGRVVAFGPHVDDAVLAAARAAGADVVMARSEFFRDPAAAVTGA